MKKNLKYQVLKEHFNSKFKDERIKMHNGGGWGDGTVSNVLAVEAGGPKFSFPGLM